MVVGQLTGSLDKFLIGWYWGAAHLGLFERSRRLVLLPIQNLNVPIGNVAFPALSRLVDQPMRYRAAYLAAVERLAMLIAPLGGLLAGAAGPVIDLALGPQWTEAAPIVAWMGLAAFYMPVTYALSWLYMSQDRTREMLRASIVGASLTIIAILCGLPFGVVGVAAAMTASGFLVRAPVLFWFAGRKGPVRTSDFYLVLIAPVCAGLAVGAALWTARHWTAVDELSTIPEVAILSLLAAVVTLSVYVALPRSRRALRSIAHLPDLLWRKRLEQPQTSMNA
jgi:PST family polysaccharide transporter